MKSIPVVGTLLGAVFMNTSGAADGMRGSLDGIEQAANHAASAIGEIGGWTERLSARAQDLEAKVAGFFQRVRAA